MSVLQLGAAKRYLRIKDISVSDDQNAELQAVIESAEQSIARKVVHPQATTLEPSEITERVVAGSALGIVGRPASAQSLVTVAGLNPGTTVDVEDLRLDTAARLVTYANGYGVFTASEYDVTYRAGFSEPFPPDLLNAIKELVRHRWKPQRGPSNNPRTGADKTDGKVVDGLPESVMNLLAPFLADEIGFA